jgi:hypothetical protein
VVGAGGYFGTRVFGQGLQNGSPSPPSPSSTTKDPSKRRRDPADSSPTGSQKAADIAGDVLAAGGLTSAAYEAAIKIGKAIPKAAAAVVPAVADNGPPRLGSFDFEHRV